VTKNISKYFENHPKVPRKPAVKGASSGKQGRKKVRIDPKVLNFVDVNQHMNSLMRWTAS
jgi:hypothetical protein